MSLVPPVINPTDYSVLTEKANDLRSQGQAQEVAAYLILSLVAIAQTGASLDTHLQEVTSAIQALTAAVTAIGNTLGGH